jgi:RES domain-containing protein
MHDQSPGTLPGTGFLRDVSGTFFRAVARDHIASALAGSHGASRYAAPHQPTLYLSVSPEGVAGAMLAHGGMADGRRTMLAFHVEAQAIFDLRDAAALARARAEAGEPFGPWQQQFADGNEPPSWRVRNWIEAQGANGLIDPSRQMPGLWHLVLFRWNVPRAPRVEPIPG